MSRFSIYANGIDCETVENMPFKDLTTFKIGGDAAVLYNVGDGTSLRTLLARLREDAVPILLIGYGSNLLVSDEGFDGAVIRFDNRRATVSRCENTLCVDAGYSLAKLSRFAQQQGLGGLTFACGIPGSVGGAVYMNAGAYGGEMVQIVKTADILEKDGSIRTYTAQELALSYRHSALMETGGIVLSATLTLTPDAPEVLHAHMAELLAARREKQPLEHPSAGSFFKRPTGYFAGKLIDDCGLRGYRVGDAQVSEKHAGFVVNRGAATCEQVKQLERDVRTRVYDAFGVTMSPEVRLIGTSWLT